MKNEWIKQQKKDRSKTMPVLSFPAVQLLDINVKQLVSSADYQVQAMKLIADMCPTSVALSMMDLSVEAEAFGSQIRFFDMDVPTVIGSIVSDIDSANSLDVPTVGLKRDGIYIEAIRKASKIIDDKPIFAGVIGPFSLTGRLMDMTEAMVNCYEDPELVHIVLRKVTEYITNYILEFKKAGASGIVMAEPAAGLLSPNLFEEFSTAYVKEIFNKVNDENFILVYHNCGNVVSLATSIMGINADVYHFGNSIDIEDMLKIMPSDKLIMGNIDPSSQFKGGSIESITAATTQLLERCNLYPNFVISSGCDIPPASKWDNINAYFDAIFNFYK